MSKYPKIAFIGAGSTVFMKNVIGDILQMEPLQGAHVALMDINEKRLEESATVAMRMVDTLDVEAKFTSHTDQKEALDGADFVIVAFQIGGYDPCTITDFEIPKEFGLRQTIADTLGIGGIMRGLRTVPHLWSICEDMLSECPDATLIQYVNPMAINMMAISRKYPQIKSVGLCHSVRWTAWGLSSDLGIPMEKVNYTSAGINHISFFLNFEEIMEDGSLRDLYPDLKRGYVEGRFPKDESQPNPGCIDKVRYEMMKRLGYFVTESSEHFAEYTPWFIKEGREDLIEKFTIPLDEYPRRCVNQMRDWDKALDNLKGNAPMTFKRSFEYAPDIILAMWTGQPHVIYGNVPNNHLIENLPQDAIVELPILVDRNGLQPTRIGKLPSQLAAVMQPSVTVQGLTVDALMDENPEAIYHAAMMDPHTSAELDLDQIWAMVDKLRKAHGEWLPEWARAGTVTKVA
ncbi:alpha-glucosidase/alpha-galactosidase [uncultured Tateyamaria sp.]|uniref:alpha-glucosidase/alpha-galactosidase n=1 Tax=uncultured Tateyamaria sp. TaxID=455651 RepID=UPI00261AEED4|nr:alpha-glucosidase/alpha-galactosidase [uncultured Tateyamaria sp.]